MSDKRLFESIRYAFAATEIKELGEALAREAQVVFDLEKKKSELASELNAEIKSANGRVSELAKKINNGYELREVECMALMETPRPGMKRIIRIDTNETIREEAMTKEEMQRSFGFQEPE